MERMGSRTLTKLWRLIITPPAPGAWNMALDESLAESVRAGAGPFLRFYGWSPGTLSLGRFQNPTSGLSAAAFEVPRVRRLTGGGGIWHSSELTYSLGCSQDDLSTAGVKPSFELLCTFLLETWRTLGWEARFAKDGHQDLHGSLGGFTPACFAGQEEYDILVGGKKLGGNAQRRDRKSIFQHGSIPLWLDREVLNRLFLPGFRPDLAATTDLHSCGWHGTAEELIPFLAQAFQKALGIEWTDSQPSSDELLRAESLVQSKFGDPAWTETGGGTLRGPVSFETETRSVPQP